MKKTSILKKYIFVIFLIVITFFFINTNGNQKNQQNNHFERARWQLCNSFYGKSYTYNSGDLRKFVCKNQKDETITIKGDVLNIYYQEKKIKNKTIKKLLTWRGNKFFFYDKKKNLPKIILINEETILKKIIEYYNNHLNVSLSQIDTNLNIVRVLEGSKIVEIKYIDKVFNLREKNYIQKGNRIIKSSQINKGTKKPEIKEKPTENKVKNKIKKIYLNKKEIYDAKNVLKKIQKEKLSITLNDSFEFEVKNFKFLINNSKFKIILSVKKKDAKTKYTILYSKKNKEMFFLNNENKVVLLNVEKIIKSYKHIFININRNFVSKSFLSFRKTFDKIIIYFYLDKQTKKLKKIDFSYKKKIFNELKVSNSSFFYSWFGKINNSNSTLLKLFQKLNKWLVVGLGILSLVVFLSISILGYKKWRKKNIKKL